MRELETWRRVPWVTIIALATLFVGLWVFVGLFEAALTVALVLSVIVAYHAFAFAWHYRKVAWRESLWGSHVMRFSLIMGVIFGLNAVLNAAAWLGYSNVPLSLSLTIVLYGAAAYELRQRRHLERLAQELVLAEEAKRGTSNE